jgi:hypothetical protein
MPRLSIGTNDTNSLAEILKRASALGGLIWHTADSGAMRQPVFMRQSSKLPP